MFVRPTVPQMRVSTILLCSQVYNSKNRLQDLNLSQSQDWDNNLTKDLRSNCRLNQLKKADLLLSTYRLTFSKTDTNVALESDVVAAGELEGIESSQQRLRFSIVVPLAEYWGVGRTAILIGHNVFVLHTVLHGLRDTTSCKTTVYTCKWSSCL